MDLTALILGLALGAALGAAIATVLATRGRNGAVARLAATEARADGLAAELERADAAAANERQLARAEAATQRERERAESAVLQQLAPVRHQLDAMHRAVAAIEEQRAAQFGELSEQLRAQHDAGERLRATTNALGAALQANQSRGAWGEAQLRNIVEAAGMLERVDFDTQRTVRGEAGTGRPDAVVSLPGGKALVIDAKAPLGRYLAAQQLSPQGDDDERARRTALLAEHARAVRGHVAALADRRYPSAVTGSPELVIAFVPSESALSAALAADPTLLEDSFARDIALTSPVSLWATLRAVAHAWRQEQLSGTAREMFELSRTLYERLATTAGHLDKLGRSLTGTVGAYNALVASIESRVLPAARRIGELDGREPLAASRQLDEPARRLSAPELTSALELASPLAAAAKQNGG